MGPGYKGQVLIGTSTPVWQAPPPTPSQLMAPLGSSPGGLPGGKSLLPQLDFSSAPHVLPEHQPLAKGCCLGGCRGELTPFPPQPLPSRSLGAAPVHCCPREGTSTCKSPPSSADQENGADLLGFSSSRAPSYRKPSLMSPLRPVTDAGSPVIVGRCPVSYGRP